MKLLLVILLIFSSNVYAFDLDDLFSPITNTTKIIKESLNLNKCPGNYRDNIWTECTAEYIYSNNDIYKGAWLNNREHGEGEYVYVNRPLEFIGKNIINYQGLWSAGKRHGKGTFKTQTNDYIHVTYRNGKINNETLTINYSNGNYYRGGINNIGQYTGQGTLIVDNITFTGRFSNNKLNGYGRIILSDGSEIRGNFNKNMPVGSMDIHYKNGDRYTGEVVNMIPNGHGKLITKSSKGLISYIGKFNNGNYSGFGKITYPNKVTYEGYWKNGKYNGEGIEILPNNDKYEGRWEDGNLIEKYSVTFDVFKNKSNKLSISNAYYKKQCRKYGNESLECTKSKDLFMRERSKKNENTSAEISFNSISNNENKTEEAKEDESSFSLKLLFYIVLLIILRYLYQNWKSSIVYTNIKSDNVVKKNASNNQNATNQYMPGIKKPNNTKSHEKKDNSENDKENKLDFDL